MEGLVNYSSEEEREDSPKRNAAERCPAHEIGPNKRSKGDSSRRPREENTRSSTNDRGRHGSSHRDKETSHSHSSSRKVNSPKESSSRGAGRFTASRDYHHRTDRRSDRAYDKKKELKDDRKRKECHSRDYDRDYEYRDSDRDRRDRSDRYRREKHSKEGSHRDKDRRRRSSESPPPTSKDRNTVSNRNRSRSRSLSKEYPSHNKTNTSMSNAENILRAAKPLKFDQKDEAASILSYPKSAPNLPAVVSFPLNDAPPKMPNVNNKLEATSIVLPTYYNPNIINPAKYAEQVQKRKLIWGAKKTEDTAAKWGHATFSEDSDGKVASKFMRLMGIKSTTKPGDAADTSSVEKTGPDVKSRQAMFSNMEQQYEVARQVTHTMRGVGLGFGSQSRQY